MTTRIALIVFALSFGACQSGNSPKAEGSESSAQSTADQEKRAPSPLEFLRELKGKYPFEVDFENHEALKSRIHALVGDRVKFMNRISDGGPSGPIEVDGDVFAAGVCMAHDCYENNYIIVCDIPKNLLYIGIKEDGKIKTYSEKGSDIKRIQEWIKQNSEG